MANENVPTIAILIIILLGMMVFTTDRWIYPITGMTSFSDFSAPELSLPDFSDLVSDSISPENRNSEANGNPPGEVQECTDQSHWCFCSDKKGNAVEPNGGFCIPNGVACEDFGTILYDCRE